MGRGPRVYSTNAGMKDVIRSTWEKHLACGTKYRSVSDFNFHKLCCILHHSGGPVPSLQRKYITILYSDPDRDGM